ncbi:hypothetical protein LAZ67_4002783 [Cordylochernes scorpioides]|uniref:Mariner transposase n=1 Tax=Cordylochernes scorpioides TaxID=51811 RepID=A0ABY6KEB3_9ARAC|nr:hypothetical protein LAZ67_4002783 [Cordylochernes scorpioides]
MTRTDPEWKYKIITGDETWVYGYDPETKRQSASGEVRMPERHLVEHKSIMQLFSNGFQLDAIYFTQCGDKKEEEEDKTAWLPLFKMLQKAFKDDCISRSQSGKWHKAFTEGREELVDEPRSGRPTTARTDENVDRVLEVLRTDRRLSIQQIADTLHMSTFVVHGIVTEDLQMLTGDESWMFEYDPESKRQSCAWHTKSSPRPKKARMSKSRIKTMIIVFFDIRGIVHCEFVPQGQTINSAFYLEVLRRLKRRIAHVKTDIKDKVKFHHDNATFHTAFIITNFLARSNTPVIPLTPLTVDLGQIRRGLPLMVK